MPGAGPARSQISVGVLQRNLLRTGSDVGAPANRVQLTLPEPEFAELRRQAGEARQTPNQMARRILSEQLAQTMTPSLPVPDRTPARLVIVRLGHKSKPGERAGWIKDMSEVNWWDAAAGDWRVAERSLGDYLAAANPAGRVEYLWRVGKWADTASGRRRAVVGEVVTSESEDPMDKLMFDTVVGRSVRPQQNPVYIR